MGKLVIAMYRQADTKTYAVVMCHTCVVVVGVRSSEDANQRHDEHDQSQTCCYYGEHHECYDLQYKQ